MVRHADGHPVGWLFLSAAALYTSGNAANHLAKMRFLDGHPDDLSAWLSWVTVWSWEVAVALLLVALVLFPHRRPPSRLAGGADRCLGVNTVVQAVSLAVLPGELDGGSHQDNPSGLDGRYETVKRSSTAPSRSRPCWRTWCSPLSSSATCPPVVGASGASCDG